MWNGQNRKSKLKGFFCNSLIARWNEKLYIYTTSEMVAVNDDP